MPPALGKVENTQTILSKRTEEKYNDPDENTINSLTSYRNLLYFRLKKISKALNDENYSYENCLNSCSGLHTMGRVL